jgi:hypothetical protein
VERAVPEGVLALAESLNSHLPLDEGQERIVEAGYAVWLGGVPHPSFNVVQRLRLEPEQVEPTVAEVRALLAGRGVTAATWEVGTSARPADLHERLLALGMRPDDEPLAVGMVLAHEPAGARGEAVARRVESVEDAVVAAGIAAAGFGMDAASAAAHAERAAATFRPDGYRATYLAYVEGEPVAFATAVFAEAAAVLGGGATLEHARGRGAYRALVQARWADARARGLGTLVTQAGSMSRPILARLGFVEVCEVRILVDSFG